jgi:uncharacterized protein (DUF2252 family)
VDATERNEVVASSPELREHLPAELRAELGEAARDRVPHGVHGEWATSAEACLAVDLLVEQANARVPELVPIRHGRMLLAPFSYYRGAALPMAAYLADTPVSGITVQLCGDAHLTNFGIFGSRERHLFFDVNDFDETAPGPWEWDVKRLAASLEVAARDNEFTTKERSRIVRRAVRAYRKAMWDFASMPMLEVWYSHLDLDELIPLFRSHLDPKKTPEVWHVVARARAHDSHQAYEHLCYLLDGEHRIVSDPPLITPAEEFVVGRDYGVVRDAIEDIIRSYAGTLEEERQHLLAQHRVAHFARKVVGVGSVGTEAWIVLLVDADLNAPLFLQVKEAEVSVVERYTSRSEYRNHGHRVVAGQRMMQASPDIFLGWVRFDWQGDDRDYYVRQLRDWKGSADVPGMTPQGLELWGRMCGWTLARTHARSGDRIGIASYLGTSGTFDRALVDFAVAFADRNERDFRQFEEAVTRGRLEARTNL